jgi:uncharacterized protein (DUF1499 family)
MCLVPFAVAGSVLVTFILTSILFATLWISSFVMVFGGLGIYCFWNRMKANPLHDIATDPRKPITFIQEPYTGANAYDQTTIRTQEKIYPDIKPFVYDSVQEGTTIEDIYLEVFRRIKSAKGWEVVATDNEEKKIQLLCTSLILRFKDDVVVQIQEDPSSSSRFLVQMRSKSRYPTSDLGYNAERIRKLFDCLEKFGAPTPSRSSKSKSY